MAKYGTRGVIGGGSGESGAAARHTIDFQQVYKHRGIELEPGDRMALAYQFHIASSRTRRTARPPRITTSP
jgi:hypothetical protein